ncbi:trafficking protein particle complex subunit 10 isoform X2 [Planococcus citri]|uniref:trafficking protein particle complex subunit 10 isoform X2 n=1 Tax=Planococcus citri TaxID=170843 RepID=UPI0031F97489
MSKLLKQDDSKYFSVSDYKPLITYSGDRDLFLNLEPIIIQALPQEPTEWRRSFGRILRAVTLNAVFIPFSEDILQKEDNYQLLKEPILHVFWTQCADIDTYKNALHDEIKNWLDVLHSHSISDWLIVLVETYDFRKHNKLLPRTTVFDRIKNDFAVKHADRCLAVINPLKSEFRTGSSWRALVVNIRLLILTSYDRALLKLEEYIRTQRECRNQPEWNFCNYFLLQEELAFVLEMLGMYEEALIQYDELDALFTQFIRNSSLTGAPKWLRSFQNPVDSWSGILLTCKVNQNCRLSLLSHSISLLDFRCYLFSRQAAMLLFTSKPWEIAHRTLPFIHNCLNEIKILEIEYPNGAIACWIFLCCFEIIFMCQNFNETAQVDACSQFTAPLLELATLKLRELGELCGLMPNCDQSSEQLHIIVSLFCGISEPVKLSSANNITPVDKLKEALSSKQAYYKSYLELSEQAMVTYKHKGRIRSARFIGKQLADFYIQLGDLSKASTFLTSVLCLYEIDEWPVLANEIRLKLLHCYKNMEETERYIKTCIAIICSPHFDVECRLSYFEEIKTLLQETKIDDSEWIVPLEEGFTLNSISVEVQQTGLRVCAIVDIVNKFPSEIVCSNVSISVSHCTNNDSKHKKIAELDSKNVLIKHFKNTKNTPAKVPLIYMLEYQQDKSLAAANVVCRNIENHLRRQDSQKIKNITLPEKVKDSKYLECNNVILKPGNNTVALLSKEEEMAGTYSMGQLSVNISDRLYFLTGANFLNKVKYSVKHVLPEISLQAKNNRILIAGIESLVSLNISKGTHTMDEDPVLILRSSDGLKMNLADQTELEDEIKINLNEFCGSSQNYSIDLNVCSAFPSQTDGSVIVHKLWLKYPWASEEVCQTIQFHVPFVVLSRIHTAKLRKFVLVTVNGATAERVVLKNPCLTIAQENISTASLNPVSAQPFIVQNRMNITFMWELLAQSANFDGKYTVKFSVDYEVYEKTSSYECVCSISDFKTLYIIESNIDPMRGCEFCRVNTMCHLLFTVKRVESTPNYSLMYEVVADQNLWAICNMSTGVIILDGTDNCSISVDLMPLISGYLPLPLIKLSKYFPVEGSGSNKGMSPRHELFHHGQVFNASKSSQVQILPSIVVADS